MKTEKFKAICPKCSYHGAVRAEKIILPGLGRKVRYSCKKCEEVFYYVEDDTSAAPDASVFKKIQLKF